MVTFRSILLVVLLFSVSACIQLQPTSLTSRYFVLEPMTVADSYYSQGTLNIIVELIEFPDYLRRPQVVTKQDNNILRTSDSKRWATPLEENIVSVIRSNLEIMLPDTSVIIGPWHTNRNHDRKLQLSVVKFSGTLGQYSDVDIRWRITTVDDEIRSGTFAYHQTVNDSHDDLIRVLNRALDVLSKELATALVLREHDPPGAPD